MHVDGSLETTAGTFVFLQDAIEAVAIGSRVAGENPQPWKYDDELPVPVQADWSSVTFSMKRDEGFEIEVEMILPTAFWQQQGTVPGEYVG